MKKIAFFAFLGEKMCFSHLLLNAMDLSDKGYDVKIIVEGQAVKLIKDLEESKNPLYLKAKGKNLFDCICKACSAQMKVLEFNETVGIPIKGEMSGHPSMEQFISQGYDIITL